MSSPAQIRKGQESWLAEEQLFPTLGEHTPDYAFILFDQNNRVLRWNVGAERLFGYKESEILGTEGSVLFTAEDRANGDVEGELLSARREGRAEDDRWHVRKDGSRFWSNGIVRPVFDGGDELKGYINILRDLTAEKQNRTVADEILIAEDLSISAQKMGYEVVGIASVSSEAVEKALTTHPDLILMDVRLDGPMDGLEAAREIRRHAEAAIQSMLGSKK